MKKLLLSLGTLAAIAAPISTVVSCSFLDGNKTKNKSEEKLAPTVNKTFIQGSIGKDIPLSSKLKSQLEEYLKVKVSDVSYETTMTANDDELFKGDFALTFTTSEDTKLTFPSSEVGAYGSIIIHKNKSTNVVFENKGKISTIKINGKKITPKLQNPLYNIFNEIIAEQVAAGNPKQSLIKPSDILQTNLIPSDILQTEIDTYQSKQTTPWETPDRSGKVISIDRGVNWIREGGAEGGTKDKEVVDIYHTALFDYVVEQGCTYDGVLFNKEIIENLAKIFEKNTVIGPAHYSDFYMGANNPICKNFPIQFLKGSGPASYGGLLGVRMVMDSNPKITPGKTVDQIGDYLGEAELMMHEYGHHEISYGGYISGDKAKKDAWFEVHTGVGEYPCYDFLIDFMHSDPVLNTYTKYFNKQGILTGAETGTLADWTSPWGVVPKDSLAWSSVAYPYIFSTGEILTRVMSEMEGTLDPKLFITKGNYLMDTLDANAMQMGFGSHPLGTQDSINRMNNLFKKFIFGLGDSGQGGDLLTGISAVKKIGAGIITTNPDATVEGEITYDIDFAAYAGNIIPKISVANGFTAEEVATLNTLFGNGYEAKQKVTLKLAPDAFNKYPVQYRLNTSFTGGEYTTETTDGIYFAVKPTPTFVDQKLGGAVSKFANYFLSNGLSTRTYKINLK